MDYLQLSEDGSRLFVVTERADRLGLENSGRPPRAGKTMDEEELSERLSRISTIWSLVNRAHRSSSDGAIAARHELMHRYHRAAYRYLLAALRDPDAADEVFQEFALRFARGDFHRADPDRGRFRQFLKSALINLVIDHRRKCRAAEPGMDDIGIEPVVHDPDEGDFEKEYLESWREELLCMAWESLEEVERDTGSPFYTVLRFKSKNPGISSPEMAARLTAELKPSKPWTEAGMRKLVQRSREKFGEVLLGEVSYILQNPTLARAKWV